MSDPSDDVFDQDQTDQYDEEEDAKRALMSALETLKSIGYDISLLDVTSDDFERMLSGPALKKQWAKDGGAYSLIGQTIGRLPPGFYETAVISSALCFFEIESRSDELLRFPHEETDTVLCEIERFWEREEIFKRYGLPYKRGILMYGPPGSGKTCALQLIARDVVARGGIVINFTPSLFVSAYRQLRSVQPDTPLVVLMEDVDVLLESRAQSGILNILDGGEPLHKVVFVATTNYPEKLGDRVLNRPSRFDKRILVGHPDVVSRRMYLEMLASGNDDLEIERFVRDTDGMSLAHVKELFVGAVLIGTPYDEVLAHLQQMNSKQPGSWEKTAGRDDDDASYL